MEYLVAFIFGLLVGSFLNVCIYRIPKGKSIVSPPSSCPSCGERIKWYDNIPVISYLLLRGRCRHCGERISLRYPVVELLTAFLTVVILWKFGLSISAFYYLILTYVLIVISFIDLDTMLVPVKLCYFAMLAGILFSPLVLEVSFKDSVLGASFGAGLILFIIETYAIFTGKEGMGYGDANIMALIGAFIGWQKVLLALFIASFVGALVGIGYILLKGKNFRVAIPFGPFLSVGGYVTVIYGNKLLEWYLGGLG
ncbi:prepilin peptidase [Phorcysia thermohydrogeniphila]|uniref:Prepilin leader peptidase/N-methyltransferase n=1 Tax=Phorcysia thermohydrogeniphila TaxID=936138 RepID=A0A4R1GAG6_9BACT|nr:A24 family peptidase [Phorcysia thermohydrogeniphila]TCK03445.1 type 4 prepilin peptidase 1 [Phorcysia thermohydrogeniphila]